MEGGGAHIPTVGSTGVGVQGELLSVRHSLMVVIVVQRVSVRSELLDDCSPCCHLYDSSRCKAYQSSVIDVRRITQVGWHGILNYICHPQSILVIHRQS